MRTSGTGTGNDLHPPTEPALRRALVEEREIADALCRLGVALSKAPTVQARLERLLAVGCQLLHAEEGTLIWKQGRRRLRLSYPRLLGTEEVGGAAGLDGLLEGLFREEPSLCIDDLALEPELSERLAFILPAGDEGAATHRSAVVALLRTAGDAPVGALAFSHGAPRLHPPRARVLLEALGAQAVLALEGELRAEAEEQHREADRLQAVASERSRLLQLLREIPAGIAVLRGRDPVVTFANPTYCALVGRGDLVGRRAREALPHFEELGFGTLYDRVLKTGTSVSDSAFAVTTKRKRRPPAERFLSFTAQPLRSISGETDGVLVCTIDVTEQVLARRRLQAEGELAVHQQRWLEQVLDQVPFATLLIEPGSANVIFANRRAVEYDGSGLPRRSDVLSMARRHVCFDTHGKRIPTEQLPAMRAARGEALHGEELTWQTALGMRSVLATSAALPAAWGHPDTVLLAFTDVTELKRVQAELQQAVHVRDDFLTIASHELNTPLTPLRLQIERLRRVIPLDEKQARMVRAAERQVTRVSRLVAQLLDVSRIVHGKLDLRPERVELRELVEETLLTLSDEQQSRVQLVPGPPVVGAWDPFRLQQVVGNLVSNALKYGGTGPVEVRVEAQGGEAVLAVTDHGRGIAREHQSRIFERYERGDARPTDGGFGLGLWITREVVQASGGRIVLSSEPGRGSTFTVFLPDQTRAAAPNVSGSRR